MVYSAIEAKAALDRCEKLCEEAEKFEKEGKRLLAAQKYLEGTIAARYVWKQVRFFCFQQYTQIMKWHHGMGGVLPPDERKTVESLAKDKREFILFRTKAYYELALNASTEGQNPLSAKYGRIVMDLVEESKAIARMHAPRGAITNERELILIDHNDNSTSVGTVIDDMGERAKQLLRLVKNLEEQNNHDDDGIVDRMGAGGGKCDCCGKKAEAIEGGELMQCSRCKMTYYCSGTCQKKCWRAGHKKACRTPGQIEVGDIMLVKGIVRKPELNKKIVKIVKPAETQGRWEVIVHGSNNNVISLASKNLFHIRPAK